MAALKQEEKQDASGRSSAQETDTSNGGWSEEDKDENAEDKNGDGEETEDAGQESEDDGQDDDDDSEDDES